MKTIEIAIGDKKAQFTTKSVTFDDKEFFYANMSNVAHNEAEHFYTFTYGGEQHTLPYEEKYAKTLNAIFSQVRAMVAKKAARDEGAVESNEEKKQEAQRPAADENASREKASSQEEKAPISSPPDKEKPNEEKPEEDSGQDKKKKASVKNIFGSAKKAKAEKEEIEKKEVVGDGIEVDPRRNARLKKSFTIFGIIIAVLLVASVIYYIAFGTSNDPNPSNPTTTESQQYDDIDELIEDLQ